jgi:murein DD-endopeptidase MepM/ murein hydrolase activator NlpD
VILIGELRDAETAETALKAAESGHLVFSTLHTIDAAETIGRMIEFFPAEKQDQIRSILAGVLRGVVSQRLLPRVEGGRVAAVEVMITNSRIADLIRERRTEEISDAIAEGQFFDMQTFAQALIDLVVAGEVDREFAANASTNRHDFLVELDQALKRKAAGVETDRPVSAMAEPEPESQPQPRATSRCRTCGSPAPKRHEARPRCGAVGASARRPGRRRRLPGRPHDGRADGSCAPPERTAARTARARSPSPRAPFTAGRCRDAHVPRAARALAAVRRGLRRAVAGARRDQQDRVELRPQHGPELGGAIGWMQFMPSTWERWGWTRTATGCRPVERRGRDRRRGPLPRRERRRDDISRAVFSYNHAQWYVDEVLQLARLFGSGGVDATFSLDRLQVSLDGARERVVRANRKLVRALRALREVTRSERRATRRAQATSLLSERLSLDRRGAQLAVSRSLAQSRVAELRSSLEQAQRDLALAKDRSLAASFAPAAGSLLAAPAYDGGYVFPVGGGPSLVSVSHHHHDYPAADIAAPEGTPVYALADGTVERAWQLPSGRCGIGLTIATADGQTWTYCHLSYLDPAVGAGATLAAGTEVGLVGQTGHATGPHLHLQLDPTTSYPQSQPWFEGFAGSAFRWQDSGASDTGAPAVARVFTVVPTPVQETPRPIVLFTR